MFKYLLLVAIVFSIGFASPVFAHEPNFEVDSSKDILKLCDFFYEEYKLLNKQLFLDHHKLFLHAKICPILYENIAWDSDHPKKKYVLISEIEKKLNENSNYLKNEHLEISSIPKEFEKKAKLWMIGEIKNKEFLNSIEDISDIDFTSKKKVKYDRVCSNIDSCLKENDYVEYTYSNNRGDKETIKFKVTKIIAKETVLGIEPKEITIGIESVKNGKKEYQEIQLDKERKFVKTFQNYYIERLVFSTPIAINDGIEDGFQVVDKAEYPILNEIREGFLADNQEGDLVTIDKETGLVLSLKHENAVLDEYFELKLESTNIFENTMFIESKEIVIPNWFKQNVQWYLDETISEKEFLSSIKHF